MARHLLHFESRHEPLLTRGRFIWRLSKNLGASIVLSVLSLLAGMAGYHHFEKMSWIDAYANASMILSGMGPLTPMETTGGKLFAGTYALYSGLVLIIATGLILAPVLHRVLHHFHLESGKKKSDQHASQNS